MHKTLLRLSQTRRTTDAISTPHKPLPSAELNPHPPTTLVGDEEMNTPSGAVVPPQAEASPGSLAFAEARAESGTAHLDQELLEALEARSGKLQILRTKAEAESGLTLVEAHIVCVQSPDANDAKKLIDSALPPHAISHLQHLRRVAKYDFLPQSVKDHLDTATPKYDSSSPSSPSTDEAPRPPPRSKGSSRGSSRSRPRRLYVIAAPTMLMSTTELALLLQRYTTQIHVLPIPYTPPSSQDEAQLWSELYWPVAFKAHNPFGPQPVFVTKALEAMTPTAGIFMALAVKAARQTHDAGYGEAFGAVIVDPSACFDGPVPVAAAGDARWRDSRQSISCNAATLSVDQRTHNGNPAYHAALRAIGMIAKQRLTLSQELPQSEPTEHGFFLDQPLTELEESIYKDSQLLRGGYLCSGLEIWLTDEPCVMCSMAILHSRFERVIFGERMPATGGMVGEKFKADARGKEHNSKPEVNGDSSVDPKAGLGYGLFWRPELNWKMLAWEWIDDNEGLSDCLKPRSNGSGSSRNEMVHV